MENLKVTDGAGARHVDSEADVYVVWDSDTRNVIYAIEGRVPCRAVRCRSPS